MSTQDHPHVRMPPPLLHLGGLFIGYVIDQALHWQPVTLFWQRPVAAVLALAGIGLILWAALLMRRHRTTILPHRAATTLITRGPYALTRNPIYLAFALLHLACAMAQGSLGMALLLPVVLYVMDRHVIAEEEAFHGRQFGAAWEQYRQRVRRWL